MLSNSNQSKSSGIQCTTKNAVEIIYMSVDGQHFNTFTLKAWDRNDFLSIFLFARSNAYKTEKLEPGSHLFKSQYCFQFNPM